MPIGHEALILAADLLEAGDMNTHMPVRLRRKGQVVQGAFHGYWDMTLFGRGHVAAVSHPLPTGGMTTGLLEPGDEILDPVPSAEEWWAEQKRKKRKQQPQKQGIIFADSLGW